MEDPIEHTDTQAEETQVDFPRRLIGEMVYGLFISAPRMVADSIRARLEAAQIPVYLDTPFTQMAAGEFYLGTYTGDVSLWVPEDLYSDAEMILERDTEGEP